MRITNFSSNYLMKLSKFTPTFLILSTLLFLFGSKSFSQEINHMDYQKEGTSLPELKIKNYYGVEFSEADIIEDRNFFVFLFNPTCYHCVEMAEVFLKHEDELSETTVFFIATEDMLELLPRFLSEIKYKESPNLLIGVDNSNIVRKLYNYGMLPQIMVYDPQKKLVKVHNGDWEWDSLKEYIK